MTRPTPSAPPARVTSTPLSRRGSFRGAPTRGVPSGGVLGGWLLLLCALPGCTSYSGSGGVYVPVTDVVATDAAHTGDSAAVTDSSSGDAAALPDGGDAAQAGDTGTQLLDSAPPADCPSCCKSSAACDDGDPCTTDTCDLGSGACKHDAIAGCGALYAPCSAQAPCKTGVCDPVSHACVPCLTAKDCGPNKACKGAICVAAATCQSDVACKATNQVCDTVQGVCVDCTGDNDCPESFACVLGMCESSPKCGSSKDCPLVCDTAKGRCVQCLTSTDCPQGQHCGQGNKCRPALCTKAACAGKALFLCKADGGGYEPKPDCDDGNPCTDDGCESAKGCVANPNAAACDDNNPCTEQDGCKGGACVGASSKCDDGNPCTNDTCDAQTGCVYKVNSAPCDDGSVCTTQDACGGGACVGSAPKDCDDKNPCTTDSCDPKNGCSHTNNDKVCDDGDACTDKDTCQGGKCVGTNSQCVDNNPCTDDGCDPSGGCKYTHNTAPCDDSNPCTEKDTCSGGQCAPGKTKVCDDKNPCTDDSCDPKAGCKSVNDDKNICSDGDACTTYDKCKSGTCSGSTKSCNDGNSCTDDSCDPKTGCKSTANSAPCSDGDACTLGDKCANKACAAGAQQKVCNDSDACTSDICDPKKGCTYLSGAGKCNDFNPCTLDTCDKASGACKTSPVAGCCTQDSQCDDKDDKTQDFCDGQVCKHIAPVVAGCKDAKGCDDGDGCTVDTCNAGKCTHTKSAGCPGALPKWDFEDGKLEGWTFNTNAKWVLGFTLQDHAGKDGGKKALRGGHAKNKTFANVTGPNYFEATTPEFTVIPGRQYRVETVYRWLLTSGSTSYNKLRLDVLIGEKTYYLTQVSGSSSSSYKAWKTSSVTFDQYAGLKVKIRLQGRIGNYSSTSSSSKASGEGVFIDELRVVDKGPAEKCTSSASCSASGSCLAGHCGSGGFCKYTFNCCKLAGECDDGDACTTDACSSGKCKHTVQQSCCSADAMCDDGKPCTKDLCDAAGTCKHVQTPGCCAENGDCKLDDGVCSVGTCDVKQGATAGTCAYKKLCCSTDKECDDGDAKCTVDKCVNAKCVHTPTGASGCCTPQLLALDFDGGSAGGFTFKNSKGTGKGWQLWSAASVSKSGKGVLYYGDPKVGNYDLGGSNYGTATLVTPTLPADAESTLNVSVYLATESSASYDYLRVYATAQGVAKTTLWKKASGQTNKWLDLKLSLAKFKGKAVTLELYFATGDGVSNKTKGAFVDDLSVTRPCPGS